MACKPTQDRTDKIAQQWRASMLFLTPDQCDAIVQFCTLADADVAAVVLKI